VARRRSPLGFQKFGGSGTINYVTKSAVEMAVYATTTPAMNHLKRAVHELIKLKLDGSVDGTKHRVVGYHIPREWSMEPAAAASEIRPVRLPARERDPQLYSTGALSYRPITPCGFQRG
jgi:hypothetical protein